jgi:hypothetical protein
MKVECNGNGHRYWCMYRIHVRTLLQRYSLFILCRCTFLCFPTISPQKLEVANEACTLHRLLILLLFTHTFHPWTVDLFGINCYRQLFISKNYFAISHVAWHTNLLLLYVQGAQGKCLSNNPAERVQLVINNLFILQYFWERAYGSVYFIWTTQKVVSCKGYWSVPPYHSWLGNKTSQVSCWKIAMWGITKNMYFMVHTWASYSEESRHDFLLYFLEIYSCWWFESDEYLDILSEVLNRNIRNSLAIIKSNFYEFILKKVW